MEPNIVLSIATTIAGTSVLLLYRGLYNRLCLLELTAHTKADAHKAHAEILQDLDAHAQRDDMQFQAVQTTLREFRTESRAQFVELRAEASEKRTEMRNDVMNLRGENNASMARIYDLLENQRTRRQR